MAQLERADLHGEIELRFPDNTSEEITPLAVRDFLHELVDSALLAASDSLELSKWVTLAQARAQLTLSPPALQAGQLYAIAGAWNAAGNSTVYVPALSNRAFHVQGVLFAGGIYALVTVDVVAGTAVAVGTYQPIPQDKWGTNDPPQPLATVNEALDYLHGRIAAAPVLTTPTKPNWNYLSAGRTLSLAHATLAASELEYSRDGGLTWLQYTGTLPVDDAKHEAGDYLGRVKAASGRNVSSVAFSPAIAAASVAVSTSASDLQIDLVTGTFSFLPSSGATAASFGAAATYNPPAVPAPTVTSLSASSGAAGDTLTVTGTNLFTTNSIRFNSTPAVFSVASATSVTVTVPAGATTGLLVLATTGGTAAGLNFTVAAGGVVETKVYHNSTDLTFSATSWNQDYGSVDACYVNGNGSTVTLKFRKGLRLPSEVAQLVGGQFTLSLDGGPAVAYTIGDVGSEVFNTPDYTDNVDHLAVMTKTGGTYFGFRNLYKR